MVVKFLANISSNHHENIISQVREIFYDTSSKKKFTSEEEKDYFFQTWVGPYLKYYRNEVLIALEDDHVLGYLTGCSDTKRGMTLFSLSGMEEFKEYFDKFPAHLHINCDQAARGKGVGSKLVEAYCQFLNKLSKSGVHIVTSPNAKNISFYKKLNFSTQSLYEKGDINLLFMGKALF